MSGHAGVYSKAPARLTRHDLLHHGFGSVLLAPLICLVGLWIMLKLFRRAGGAFGMQRIGWHILMVVAAGVVPPSAERRRSNAA